MSYKHYPGSRKPGDHSASAPPTTNKQHNISHSVPAIPTLSDRCIIMYMHACKGTAGLNITMSIIIPAPLEPIIETNKNNV